MFVSELSTDVQLRNYSLILSPQSNFLDIQGEFQIESKIFIPSNVIELSYVFPFQKIEGLFAKTDGQKCQSSHPSLLCYVYTNSAIASLDKDRYFNLQGHRALQVPMITQFSLNSSLETGRKWENKELKELHWTISRQLENLSFQRKFEMHYHPRKRLPLAQENNLDLEFTTKIELSKHLSERYSSQKLHLHIPSWVQMLNKGLLVKHIFSAKLSDFKLTQLLGKFRGSGEKALESFSLNASVNQEIVLNGELLKKLKNFGDKLESIDLDLSFSDGKNTRLISLSLMNEKKIGEYEGSLVLKFTPDDALFKEVSFDSSWEVESL